MDTNVTNPTWLSTQPVNRGGGAQNTSEFRVALISFEAINVFTLSMSLYTSACVITYGCVTGAWRKKHGSLISKGQMDRGIIYTLCTISIVVDLPRLILSEVVYKTKTAPGAANCGVLVDTTSAAWSLAYFTKYVFLWYRQYTINCHPAIKVFTSKWARGMSYAHIAVYVALHLLTTVLYVNTTRYKNSPKGCVIVLMLRNGTNPDVSPIRLFRAYLLVSAQITSQLILLVLFIYPLYRSWARRKKLSKKTACNENIATGTSAQPSGDGKKNSVLTLLQRSLAATAITCFFDVIAMTLWYVNRKKMAVAITITYYNISLVIYSFCTLATFSFRRDILTIFETLIRRAIQARLRARELNNQGVCVINT